MSLFQFLTVLFEELAGFVYKAEDWGSLIKL